MASEQVEGIAKRSIKYDEWQDWHKKRVEWKRSQRLNIFKKGNYIKPIIGINI